MPPRSQKECNKAGCYQLTRNDGGYCDKHLKYTEKEYDKRRGTATQRGYDYRWSKVRDRKLRADPFCECPRCVNTHRVATMVHHIKPVETHPELRLVWGNLMSLTRECHEIIEGRKQINNEKAV